MLLPFRLLGFLGRDFLRRFLRSILLAVAAVDVNRRAALNAFKRYRNR
jgi:hypothetical protein